MRLLSVSKDGGSESRVWAHWLVEWKRLFSVVLLRFEDGSREAYHEHAFNSISWVLSGSLEEQLLGSSEKRRYKPSWRPVLTYRSTFHQVASKGRTWVLSFRGPWVDRWREHLPETGQTQTLTHGRKEIQSQASDC